MTRAKPKLLIKIRSLHKFNEILLGNKLNAKKI